MAKKYRRFVVCLVHLLSAALIFALIYLATTQYFFFDKFNSRFNLASVNDRRPGMTAEIYGYPLSGSSRQRAVISHELKTLSSSGPGCIFPTAWMSPLI